MTTSAGSRRRRRRRTRGSGTSTARRCPGSASTTRTRSVSGDRRAAAAGRDDHRDERRVRELRSAPGARTARPRSIVGRDPERVEVRRDDPGLRVGGAGEVARREVLGREDGRDQRHGPPARRSPEREVEHLRAPRLGAEPAECAQRPDPDRPRPGRGTRCCAAGSARTDGRSSGRPASVTESPYVSSIDGNRSRKPTAFGRRSATTTAHRTMTRNSAVVCDEALVERSAVSAESVSMPTDSASRIISEVSSWATASTTMRTSAGSKPASRTARVVRTTSSAECPAESIHASTRAASAGSATLIRAPGA